MNKPSILGFSVRVSQKAQVEVYLFPEWYLHQNLYHVTANLNYIHWPADFYGIGNGTDILKESADAYLAQGMIGDVTVERKWFQNFSAGPQVLMKYESIDPKGKHGLLTQEVQGQVGGTAVRLGTVMTYDRRDAIYWARRETFLHMKNSYYRNAFGSDFDFESYFLEARQFIPMFSTGALGISALLNLKSGDIPFRELATADGDHNLRGIVRGKYRDRDMLVLQGEYKSYLPDYSWISHRWFRNRLGYAMQ